MSSLDLLVILYALCWASFLNVVAYRLLNNVPFFLPRSRCPSCKKTIAWYDLLPLLSWLLLKARCRNCKASISWLYPFIELIGGISFSLLFYWVPLHYFFSYFLFFSALIITIRTDLEELTILRYFSLGIIPLGWWLSFTGYLPISLIESIGSSLCCALFLWGVQQLFFRVKGQIGLGQGDIELFGAIGAFLGFLGSWATLLIGSLIGSITGIIYLIFSSQKIVSLQLPFGAFLALGAIIATLVTPQAVVEIVLRIVGY